MKENSSFSQMLSILNRKKWNYALKGIITGILAGVLVVLYRVIIEYGTETSLHIYDYLRENPIYILLWLPVIAFSGMVITFLVKYEPMAAGSGIPQVEGIVLYGLKIREHTVLAVRFIAGAICSFMGLSLGREGPSIQIGSSGGQLVASKLSNNKLEDNYMVTAGAAAGLSAAFNAPLSGMVFALEEIHKNFNIAVLLTATAAALTSDMLSKLFFGLKPVLSFADTPSLPLSLYFLIIPLGIISGITGSAMNRMLLDTQTLFKKVNFKFRITIVLLIALVVGLLLPDLLGGGLNLIDMSMNSKGTIRIIIVLLLGKMLFTSLSFGSGAPGGIFMPVLSVGALSGLLLGLIAVKLGLDPKYIPDFCVCAMAGALSSCVKAPVTSILLIAEMTGSLTHLMPVAAVSFFALFVSDILKIHPVYEVLLERIMKTVKKEDMDDEHAGILELAVEVGSPAAGKLVKDIQWPQGVLLAGITRGVKNIIPRGNTMILPGDYLSVLVSKEADDLPNDLRSVCGCDPDLSELNTKKHKN